MSDRSVSPPVARGGGDRELALAVRSVGAPFGGDGRALSLLRDTEMAAGSVETAEADVKEAKVRLEKAEVRLETVLRIYEMALSRLTAVETRYLANRDDEFLKELHAEARTVFAEARADKKKAEEKEGLGLSKRALEEAKKALEAAKTQHAVIPTLPRKASVDDSDSGAVGHFPPGGAAGTATASGVDGAPVSVERAKQSLEGAKEDVRQALQHVRKADLAVFEAQRKVFRAEERYFDNRDDGGLREAWNYAKKEAQAARKEMAKVRKAQDAASKALAKAKENLLIPTREVLTLSMSDRREYTIDSLCTDGEHYVKLEQVKRSIATLAEKGVISELVWRGRHERIACTFCTELRETGPGASGTGHSVIVTGLKGSGKSFLLQSLVLGAQAALQPVQAELVGRAPQRVVAYVKNVHPVDGVLRLPVHWLAAALDAHGVLRENGEVPDWVDWGNLSGAMSWMRERKLYGMLVLDELEKIWAIKGLEVSTRKFLEQLRQLGQQRSNVGIFLCGSTTKVRLLAHARMPKGIMPGYNEPAVQSINDSKFPGRAVSRRIKSDELHQLLTVFARTSKLSPEDLELLLGDSDEAEEVRVLLCNRSGGNVCAMEAYVKDGHSSHMADTVVENLFTKGVPADSAAALYPAQVRVMLWSMVVAKLFSEEERRSSSSEEYVLELGFYEIRDVAKSALLGQKKRDGLEHIFVPASVASCFRQLCEAQPSTRPEEVLDNLLSAFNFVVLDNIGVVEMRGLFGPTVSFPHEATEALVEAYIADDDDLPFKRRLSMRFPFIGIPEVMDDAEMMAGEALFSKAGLDTVLDRVVPQGLTYSKERTDVGGIPAEGIWSLLSGNAKGYGLVGNLGVLQDTMEKETEGEMEDPEKKDGMKPTIILAQVKLRVDGTNDTSVGLADIEKWAEKAVDHHIDRSKYNVIAVLVTTKRMANIEHCERAWTEKLKDHSDRTVILSRDKMIPLWPEPVRRHAEKYRILAYCTPEKK